MTLLDFDETYVPPFAPPKEEPYRDNFEELQNMGHEILQDDYSNKI